MTSRPFLLWLLVTLTWAGLYLARVTAPIDWIDNDQQRPAAYILDVLRNGDWVVQTDEDGDITSKPPLPTWIGALIALPWGRLTAWNLPLTSGLAVLATAWLALGVGGRRFGAWAGVLGAMMLLLSQAGMKSVALVRTDPMFMFTVAAAALLAWHAWGRGGSWIWFWLTAALATLTKGPLGLVLAAMGLLAALWERKAGYSAAGERARAGGMGLGVMLYLLLCGGWFVAAYAAEGQAVIDKMIGKELVGHATGSYDDEAKIPLIGFWKPPVYFLSRFTPWGVLSIMALVRVFRSPAADPTERCFERFLTLWFLGGMAIFCAVPHQRADHLLPLIPAAAILAGREAARWWRPNVGKGLTLLAAGAALIVVGSTLYLRLERATDDKVQESVAAWRLGQEMRGLIGRETRLAFVEDAPFTIQIALNIIEPDITREDAAELLQGPEPVYVVAKNVPKIYLQMPEGGAQLRQLYSSPSFQEAQARGAQPSFWILANRPALPDRVAEPYALPEPNAFGVVLLALALAGLLAVGAWGCGRALRE